MNSINSVFLLGRLGHEPEVNHTSAGHTVCKLSLATNRRVKDGDDWIEQTQWHTVKLWRHNAELADQYLNKGDTVAIEGRLQEETWTSSDGEPRRRTVVQGHRLTLLPKGGPAHTGSEDTAQA